MTVTGGRSFQRLQRFVSSGGAPEPMRLRVQRHGQRRTRGEYVVYWMQAARRIENNMALRLACDEATRLGLPLLVYEALRSDYPSANLRLHTFVLDGVTERAGAAAARALRHSFFLPRTAEEGRGQLYRLLERAASVVTDEFPAWMLRAQTQRLIQRAGVEVILVDHNGILPMRALPGEQYAAKQFRDRAHRMFDDHWPVSLELERVPEPWRGGVPYDEWVPEDAIVAARRCVIDDTVPPVSFEGTRAEGLRRLGVFIDERLDGYDSRRSREAFRTSELSPWIHFGILGAHEIANAVLLSSAPQPDIDAFLEELVIRRELSFNFCFFNPSWDSIEALPAWARKTLDEHRDDRRHPLYSEDAMERAETADDVWNLAQQGLLVTGTTQNYLRMLWGKRILEWTPDPETAHRLMIRIHEKWALDGRDPNTYGNVLWCLGKHDRPWAPARPVFGMVRYMSSASTTRKVDLKGYRYKLEREAELVASRLASVAP